MHSLDFRHCLVEESFPILRRMAVLQHFLENSVRIMFTFKSAFALLIIDPGVNDDPASLVEAKEKSVLLKKFCPKPMLSGCSQGFALAIFRSMRVLGDEFKRQLDNSSKSFSGIFFQISLGIVLAQ